MTVEGHVVESVLGSLGVETVKKGDIGHAVGPTRSIIVNADCFDSADAVKELTQVLLRDFVKEI